MDEDEWSVELRLRRNGSEAVIVRIPSENAYSKDELETIALMCVDFISDAVTDG